MKNEQIIVYTKPGCAACRAVKEFLSKKQIEFVERNVESDDQAFAELATFGLFTTPVTVIGDQKVVGFDRLKLEALLSQHEQVSEGA